MTQMKYVTALALSTVLAATPALGRGPGSTFTYQGRLVEAGRPVSGTFDFPFKLYDAASGGTLVAGPLAADAWHVEAGLLTMPLDFGSAPFDGQPRWLDVAVRATGGGSYTVLSPRQPITAAPYALRALTRRRPVQDVIGKNPGCPVDRAVGSE